MPLGWWLGGGAELAAGAAWLAPVPGHGEGRAVLWQAPRAGRDPSLRAAGMFTWSQLIIFVLFAFEIVHCIQDRLPRPNNFASSTRSNLLHLYSCGGRRGAVGNLLSRMVSEQQTDFEPTTSDGPSVCRAADLNGKYYFPCK